MLSLLASKELPSICSKESDLVEINPTDLHNVNFDDMFVDFEDLQESNVGNVKTKQLANC